MSFFIYRNT